MHSAFFVQMLYDCARGLEANVPQRPSRQDQWDMSAQQEQRLWWLQTTISSAIVVEVMMWCAILIQRQVKVQTNYPFTCHRCAFVLLAKGLVRKRHRVNASSARPKRC